MDKLLSIIIPYYNTKKYTDQLLDCLNKQITDEIEVILVDDGSKEKYKTDYKWCKIIRQENGGASKARNTGINNVKGKYLAFIDSDDLVADNYIFSIINKIKSEKFDYCYLSWKTLDNISGGFNCEVKLNSINDKFPPFNLCCWNRIYLFDLVKNIRFPENKLIAEDADYIRQAESVCKKKSFIGDFMYYYRSDTPNSLTKRFASGELYTQRAVINYNKITNDMTWLIDQAKKLNEVGEVIIMTNYNEIPELNQYAMVTTPMEISGTSFYGEPSMLFKKINLPIKTQVVIWTDYAYVIGGMETFIYNFCVNMYKDYDIIVLYNHMGEEQKNRLRPYVQVVKHNPKTHIICDTLIVNKITDMSPANVEFQQKIQMVHVCKMMPDWKIPTDYNKLVCVSDVVGKSFNIADYNVIHNLTRKQETQKILRLISATRFTFEKGGERIKILAKLLNKNNIPFVWSIFSDEKLDEDIDGIIYMKPTLNLANYIADCDYLVQLSDQEAFGYSIVEALELGTPVITTPIPVLNELGIKDGVHGIFVPFDMNDIDVNKIYNSKFNFKYSNNNESIKKQWKKILGNTKPKGDYVYVPGEIVTVKAIQSYFSYALNRQVDIGEILETTRERAEVVINANVCEAI